MLTLLLVVVVVVSCWHCQWWWWWCGKAGSSQQLLLTTGALSTEENLQCSEDTECNHCSTECNALSREERWKLRQPKNESCALPARSQPFTSSGVGVLPLLKKFYPKNYRLEYFLTDIITRTFAQQGQSGVFVTRVIWHQQKTRRFVGRSFYGQNVQRREIHHCIT